MNELVLHNANIWVGDGTIQSNVDIKIKDGRIAQIAPAGQVSSNQGIDVGGKWVLPGLIDGHTHLWGSRRPDSLHWAIDPQLESAFRALKDAQSLLSAGFTTVREAGGKFGTALQRVIDTGELVGPRIVPAWLGLARTGGHGDCHALPIHWVRERPSYALIADGADELRRAVRTVNREGGQWVKVWASGAVFGAGGPDNPRHTHYSNAELTTVVEEAHSVDLRVGAHCTSLGAVKQCLDAGVDSIEHGYELDQEVCHEMRQRGVWLVSTLSTLERAGHSTDPDVPSEKRERALRYLEMARSSVALAFESGVELVMGSDAFAEPLTPYRDAARELIYMHRGAGIPPDACLKAATLHAARLINRQDDLGTVEDGKAADLIVATTTSPIDDLSTIVGPDRLTLVIKGGEVMRLAGLGMT